MALSLMLVLLVGCAAPPAAPPTTETPPPQEQPKQEVNALVFYHWWTSASEAASINALIGVFTSKYPDTAVMPAPVVGGAGYSMLGLIKPLVLAGEAPDAFQMHAGYEAKPYYDAGLLEPIDSLWKSEGLEAVIPKVVQDMCKFDGNYYAVPVNVHRVNVIWYNKKLLDDNNINPASLTTWDAFFAACDKLKAAGVEYPIQLGESWTQAHTFEQILASEGIDFYQDLVNGKITSASDPKLVAALETFKKYLTYVNPDYEGLGWDAATKRIISGESAFNVMGDWANGEFKLVGMVYGKDYGTIGVPGTQDMYGLCIDTFQHPKGVAHPTNSERWLGVVASKDGQDAFNPKKGSIAARSDADLTKYDDYQKAAITDFKTLPNMFPSIVHGSGAPNDFKAKLNEVVPAFVKDKDVSKAASALAAAAQASASQFTTVWSLE
ncbi:extracellular solute-binding protein [Candidatus Woesearchaeota archaeon]|nr:extracellular solute-binding protein [Candidatus Woesearchaeota archaeon]